MARLNPRVSQIGAVGGGKPDLETTDIAGALAFVTAGLGRELLEFVWWHDGARNRSVKIDGVLNDLQFAEYSRRETAMYAALGAVACGPVGEERRHAHDAYARAHANRWPSWIKRLEPLELSDGYALIRSATLEEISKLRACSECEGKGTILKRDLVMACSRCKGDGRLPYGPTWRATRLHMKEPSFKKTWEGPYEWLFARMTEALSDAERELAHAVQ